MIIASQQVGRIGQITKVGTPEPNDGAIQIPNTVLEPIPFPLLMPGLNGTVFADSFITTGTLLRTNQAAITQPLGTLVPGLWRIRLFIDVEFNWTSGTLSVDAFYQFLDSITADTANLWLSPARVSRTILDLRERVFLLKNNTTFQINLGLTGVGQTSQLITVTEAERLL